MKFSIIVPIYSVEKYLKECVDSILNQSYKDYEIILVDDGSPDNCPAICDEYAERYPFIKVIHKKNGGLSDARNSGMEQAQGEYIVFVDSDDYIVEGCLEKVAKRIETFEKADVIQVDFCTFYDGEDQLEYPEYSIQPAFYDDWQEFITDAIKNKNLKWNAFANVWSNRFIKDKGVVFPKGLAGAEDFDFFFRVIRCNPTILYSGEVITAYRLNRVGSIMTDNNLRAVLDRCTIFRNHFDFYASQPSNLFNDFMMENIANYYCNNLWIISKFKKQQKKQIIQKVKGTGYIVQKATINRLKLFYAISILCGFYNASKIVMWLVDIKSIFKRIARKKRGKCI